jgi:hypothetical protein
VTTFPVEFGRIGSLGLLGDGFCAPTREMGAIMEVKAP